VQKETYAELLEKFYPGDGRENDKYRFSSFGKKLVSESREKGQDETIKDFRDEIKAAVDKKNVLGNDFSNDQSIARNFETLWQLQEAGRAARQENESIFKQIRQPRRLPKPKSNSSRFARTERNRRSGSRHWQSKANYR
jgi:hypothetical protein